MAGKGYVKVKSYYPHIVGMVSGRVSHLAKECAEGGMAMAQSAYEDGKKPETDTGGSINSFYLVSSDGTLEPKRSYVEAVASALDHWQTKYTPEESAGMVLPEVEVPESRDSIKAGFATMAVPVVEWNEGHISAFTGMRAFFPMITNAKNKYRRQYLAGLRGILSKKRFV